MRLLIDLQPIYDAIKAVRKLILAIIRRLELTLPALHINSENPTNVGLNSNNLVIRIRSPTV